MEYNWDVYTDIELQLPRCMLPDVLDEVPDESNVSDASFDDPRRSNDGSSMDDEDFAETVHRDLHSTNASGDVESRRFSKHLHANDGEESKTGPKDDDKTTCEAGSRRAQSVGMNQKRTFAVLDDGDYDVYDRSTGSEPASTDKPTANRKIAFQPRVPIERFVEKGDSKPRRRIGETMNDRVSRERFRATTDRPANSQRRNVQDDVSDDWLRTESFSPSSRREEPFYKSSSDDDDEPPKLVSEEAARRPRSKVQTRRRSRIPSDVDRDSDEGVKEENRRTGSRSSTSYADYLRKMSELKERKHAADQLRAGPLPYDFRSGDGLSVANVGGQNSACRKQSSVHLIGFSILFLIMYIVNRLLNPND